MIHQRKKRNSSKVNLTISFVFHGALILGIFYLAAREGVLGNRLKQLALIKVAPEKKPEPPKPEKAPEPKVAQPKQAEEPKTVAVAPPPRMEAAAPPPGDAAPAVAPPPSIMQDFSFEGGHAVVTGDANTVYKGLIEHALFSHWQRPEDIDDATFVAEVELSVDKSGTASEYNWLRGSGNPRWDNTVKDALTRTKAFSRPPPKGFPAKFTVRFDVESQRTEEVLQVSQLGTR